MRRLLLLGLVLTLTLFSSAGFAQDQLETISISKDDSLRLQRPDAAGNTRNGSILVAWREMDLDAGESKIYTALLRVNLAGELTITKPIVVAAEAGNFPGLSLAYNSKSGTFMLCYVYNDDGNTQIWAQRLNPRGRAVGNPKLVASDFLSNQNPVVISYENGPLNKGEFRVFWSVTNAGAGDGVYHARLLPTGTVIDGVEAVTQLSPGESDGGEPWAQIEVNAVMERADGSIWINGAALHADRFERDGFLILMDENLNQLDTLQFDFNNTFIGDIFAVSATHFVSLWQDNELAHIQRLALKPNRGKKIGSLFTKSPIKFGNFVENVSGKGAILVGTDGGNINLYTAQVRPNGTIAAPVTIGELIDDGGIEPRALWFPGKDYVAIIYRSSLLNEVAASTFKP